MKYILGIDVGTQSVKAGLVNLAGMKMERIASREYPGAALQDSETLWEAACGAVAELTGSLEESSMIEGVGLSGQMHGTVLYDAGGKVIGPVINWQDERANAPTDQFDGKTTIERMTEIIGGEIFHDLGIDVMASGFLGATLFHLKEFEPELFGKVANVVLPTDFIRRRLTNGGPFVTDVTNAFSTGVFNTRGSVWHEECIHRIGLPMKIFPDVRRPGDFAGGIGVEAAKLTGLAAGTPVTVGGGDNQMSMIGSGVFDAESPLLINIGTSGQVCGVIDKYIKVDGVDTRSFVRGKFALVGAGITGGICYTWLRNIFSDDIKTLGVDLDRRGGIFRLMDELADKIPFGAEGLRFEPFLRGTRREPAKRAAFTGIGRNNFTLGHRARAVMEGVVAELVGFYNHFEGVKASSLTGAGNGLVKSDIWRRITAQTFGMPLRVMDFENAVYGAALVAAEGLNLARLEDGNFEYVKPDFS